MRDRKIVEMTEYQDSTIRSVARLGLDLGELLVSIKMTAVITQ